MSGTPAGRPTRVSRRQLVAGMGAAAFGGVIAGGAGGFAGARSTESEAASGGGGEGAPLKIGALVPVTGFAAADGQEMLRGLSSASPMSTGAAASAGGRWRSRCWTPRTRRPRS